LGKRDGCHAGGRDTRGGGNIRGREQTLTPEGGSSVLHRKRKSKKWGGRCL